MKSEEIFRFESTGNYFDVRAHSKDGAAKIFSGLLAGEQIEMPIEDSPWGTHFGMFRDK